MKNITNVFYEFLIALCCLMSSSTLWAWEDMPMPRLHVEGRYLVDPHGNKVNLHGFAQTYSPWFNEMGQKWDNYDVAKCLKYNQGLIDDIIDGCRLENEFSSITHGPVLVKFSGNSCRRRE